MQFTLRNSYGVVLNYRANNGDPGVYWRQSDCTWRKKKMSWIVEKVSPQVLISCNNSSRKFRGQGSQLAYFTLSTWTARWVRMTVISLKHGSTNLMSLIPLVTLNHPMVWSWVYVANEVVKSVGRISYDAIKYADGLSDLDVNCNDDLYCKTTNYRLGVIFHSEHLVMRVDGKRYYKDSAEFDYWWVCEEYFRVVCSFISFSQVYFPNYSLPVFSISNNRI